MTSGGREINVTKIAAINAIGNHFAHVDISSRVFQGPHVTWCTTGFKCRGKSIRMVKRRAFLQYQQHFKVHVKPTEQEKVLLILDKHDSHIAVHVNDLAKEYNIVLLSLPPQTLRRTLTDYFWTIQNLLPKSVERKVLCDSLDESDKEMKKIYKGFE